MRNKLVVALIVAGTFGLIALLMVKVMPEPLEPFDFMLIGSMATLVSMLVLFLMLVGPRLKSGDVFVKRRRKR